MSRGLNHLITDVGFSSAACRRLLDYWRSRSETDQIPSWSDIELIDLQRDIGRIVVKDIADSGNEYTIRFCGDEIAPHFANGQTGTRLDEVFSGHELEHMHIVLKDACTSMAPVKLQAQTFNGFNGALEAVVLPILSDRGNKPAHIIALFDFGR